MTRRIFIIVIILAILATLLIINQRNTTLTGSDSAFSVEDTSAVQMIFLADMNDRDILLERQPDNSWTVNENYQASKPIVEIILQTMYKMKVREPAPKAARDNIISRMSSIGIKVEIYETVHRIDIFGLKLFPRTKLSKTFYVGDNTRDNTGTYMKMADAEQPYVMHIPGFRGFLHTRFSTKLADWRDHEIFSFRLPQVKSFSVEFPEQPEQSYKIISKDSRTFDLVSLKNNQPVANYDTIKVLDVLSSLYDVRLEQFINQMDEHKKDSIITSTPFTIINIEDTAGNKVHMKTFHKAPKENELDIDGTPVKYDRDAMYALINDEKDFVTVQFYIFDNIIRNLSFLKGEIDDRPSVFLEAPAENTPGI